MPSFRFLAIFGAKYVKIAVAPARLIPIRDSFTASSSESHPFLMAAISILYSPDT